MRTFLLKIFLFIIVSFVLLFVAARLMSIPNESKNFTCYDTDENLFTIGDKEHFDFLFMGISHARNFTRHHNHDRVEQLLNRKFVNIGRAGGKGGPLIEYKYLQYFFSRGNETDLVIYVPTPPMFYSNNLNVNSSAFSNEPFRLRFFFLYLIGNAENKPTQLYYYLRSKFTKQWFNLQSGAMDSVDWSLEKYDSLVIQNGFKLAYPEGLDQKTFYKNQKIIRKTLDLCVKKNSKVIFLMTPSMFGKWPGHEEVFNFLEELQKEYNITIYDYSEVCKNPEFYFDHHHFNSKGVNWFTTTYLKPVIEKELNEQQTIEQTKR